MSKTGRPRKPKEVLKLHGTYREDRHGGRVEAFGLPQKPDSFDEHASWMWDSVISQVQVWGASSCDTAALISLCEWWSRYRKIMVLLDDPEAEHGYKLQILAAQAFGCFSKMASKFGLTPVDRANLKAPQKTEDDLDKFLDETA